MRAAALSWAASASTAIALVACSRPAATPGRADRRAGCPPGVVAQTPAGDYAFTQGWVRLTLPPCPRAAAPAAWLEVKGASSFLAFGAGRTGGVTAGVLRSIGDRALVEVQRFPIPPGSAAAREVVLAPLEAGAPAARLKQVRLTAE